MKGDFSADHFRVERRYLRVLMQQGRVQLDSDWNEQAAILVHHLRAVLADLIGPFGGPGDDPGFAIRSPRQLTPAQRVQLTEAGLLPIRAGDVLIGPGHYYVDGILCESDAYTSYLRQPDLPASPLGLEERSWLIYLDVWERHVTAAQDPGIREVALGGPDTASRSRVVWQVMASADIEDASPAGVRERWPAFVAALRSRSEASLKARADNRYSGSENHLYRIEIHDGGSASAAEGDPAATFKWSRDNGSVVFPLAATLEGSVAVLTNLGGNGSHALREGDWVELIDDDLELMGLPGRILRIEAVDPERLQVTLSDAPRDGAGRDLAKHPLLRRWDQDTGGDMGLASGVLRVLESDEDRWLELEDGVQIQFQPGGAYRTGDYWLIPARITIGDVVWPTGEDGFAIPRPPTGIEHHYAPLAAIRQGGEPVDCRTRFPPLGRPC